MELQLPKATLVAGEELEAKLQLSNLSSTNVEGVSLQLTQRITFKVTEPGREERQDSRKLVELNDVGLGAHGEHTYVFRVGLPPTVELPNFVQCRLFGVEYFYKVQVTDLSSGPRSASLINWVGFRPWPSCPPCIRTWRSGWSPKWATYR